MHLRLVCAAFACEHSLQRLLNLRGCSVLHRALRLSDAAAGLLARLLGRKGPWFRAHALAKYDEVLGVSARDHILRKAKQALKLNDSVDCRAHDVAKPIAAAPGQVYEHGDGG